MSSNTTKSIVKLAVRILIFPLYLLFRLLTTPTKSPDRTFMGFSQFLSLIPGTLGIYCRAAFYHLACPRTSENISIGFLSVMSHQDTSIEEGAYIGPQCNIGKCHIKPNCLIGSGVHILSGNKQHNTEDLNKPIQEQGGSFTKIEIGDDCWIGNGAIVMAPLESQTIVAAGSVVTKPSSHGDILAGNPAKRIKNRNTTFTDVGEHRTP